MSSRCPWIFKTVCLPISSLCLHIWLGLSSLYFIYSYLPKICVFTFYSPCSFKQPSNCFHSFFSLFPFSLCLRLTSLYIPFISPRCLSLPFYVPLPFPFSTLFHLTFYLFYLSSFISFHYFSHTLSLHIYSPSHYTLDLVFLLFVLVIFWTLSSNFSVFSTCLSSSTDPAIWLSSDFHR